MNTLRIGIRDGRTQFAPHEEISGAVLWEVAQAPASAELRLAWFTRGKGSEDSAVAATVVFDSPLAGDTRPFSLRLPEAPYSFSGKLISLVWVLELVLNPGNHFVREEITISPNGAEILLPEGPAPDLSRPWVKFQPS